MGMNKPSQTYPSPPAQTANSTPPQMPMLLPDPSIFGASFDQLLAQRGVRMLHSRAIPCPNLAQLDNSSHDPNCSFCDLDGFIYYGEVEIWGTFGGNSIQKTFEAHGVWETGMATVTCPTEYPDGSQADFNTYDKLIIPDFTVRLWEIKEYEPTSGNLQDLRYPIVNVDLATAIVGGVQVFYQLGTDFNINGDGQIVWLNPPAYDSETGHGQVVSWAYYAMPVYLVVQTLRELRITQELQAAGKTATRLPQSILVKRDFFPGAGETIGGP
jgi:hypothetical protein